MDSDGVCVVDLLQAAVIKQDSILELLQQPQEATAGPGQGLAQPRTGSATGELVLLQRQHSLLQEELLRLRDAENRFKDSEKARAKLERQVRHLRAHCGEAAVQVSTTMGLQINSGPQNHYGQTPNRTSRIYLKSLMSLSSTWSSTLR